MDETTKAYIAGIMDGEGTIGIYITRSGNGYHGHTLQTSVAMTDAQAVQLIAETYGASTHINKAQGNSKDRLVVTIRADKAMAMLRDILPYLRVKREHAEIGIAFQESRTNLLTANDKGWGKGRKPITAEEWNRRESFRLRMYAINSGRLGAKPSDRVAASTEWRGAGKPVKRQSGLHGNMQSTAEMTVPLAAGEG